jgi:ATP-binding protein involved in chromosome partitioning
MIRRQSIPGVSHVLAVASGKGGVGKTTVAVNLALALHQCGARVGLFDADVYGPNVPLMPGVRRKQLGYGYATTAREGHIPYIQPLQRLGLKAMSIGFVVGDAQAVMLESSDAGQMIRQTIQDVIWGELDYLLVDFPPGSGEPQQTLLRTIHFDGVLIVTTPQDMSLMDASRSLGMFRQAGVPIIGVIENMSYFSCPHCGEQTELFGRSQGSWAVSGDGIPQLGRIPLDGAIGRRAETGYRSAQTGDGASVEHIFSEIAFNVRSGLQKDGGDNTPRPGS